MLLFYMELIILLRSCPIKFFFLKKYKFLSLYKDILVIYTFK